MFPFLYDQIGLSLDNLNIPKLLEAYQVLIVVTRYLEELLDNFPHLDDATDLEGINAYDADSFVSKTTENFLFYDFNWDNVTAYSDFRDFFHVAIKNQGKLWSLANYYVSIWKSADCKLFRIRREHFTNRDTFPLRWINTLIYGWQDLTICNDLWSSRWLFLDFLSLINSLNIKTLIIIIFINFVIFLSWQFLWNLRRVLDQIEWIIVFERLR